MHIENSDNTINGNKDEIEKRKPKPFRYILNDENNEDNFGSDNHLDFSIMKDNFINNDFEDINGLVLGNNRNAEIIEGIITKHIETKKMK